MPEGESSGGQAALVVAVAHLTELLNSIEAANSQAMFLVGLNMAITTLFFAMLLPLGQDWYWAITPTVIVLLVFGVGLRRWAPSTTFQFPRPLDLLSDKSRGQSDDELAWEAVEAIALASVLAQQELVEKALRVYWLRAATLMHLLFILIRGVWFAVS